MKTNKKKSSQTKYLLIIIGVLLLGVAYFLGKNQTINLSSNSTIAPTTIPTPTLTYQPVPTDTPTPTVYVPPFDYNGCSTRALQLTTNCANVCLNEANVAADRCLSNPSTALSCTQNISNQNTVCNNNCKSNHINYINNCNVGIWP